jgi:hypothetical protein
MLSLAQLLLSFKLAQEKNEKGGLYSAKRKEMKKTFVNFYFHFGKKSLFANNVFHK